MGYPDVPTTNGAPTQSNVICTTKVRSQFHPTLFATALQPKSTWGKQCATLVNNFNSISFGRSPLSKITFTAGIDCQWGEWETWSSCSQTCGTGERSRNRKETVLAYPPGIGKECEAAKGQEKESCNLKECQGKKISRHCSNYTVKLLTFLECHAKSLNH